jgi:hypothetical protein
MLEKMKRKYLWSILSLSSRLIPPKGDILRGFGTGAADKLLCYVSSKEQLSGVNYRRIAGPQLFVFWEAADFIELPPG